ncbi:MAG: hypothetical protein AAGA47_12460 [Pseudomonadota bacterium]
MRLPVLTLTAALSLLALQAPAQSPEFGDDSGSYTRDGECDDRRFFGPDTAPDIDSENIGRDASDCRAAFEAGTAFIWNQSEAAAATSCEAIDFGNDGSDYADDGECDDPRFEGIGAATTLLSGDRGRDATDCRRLCELEAIFIREYGTY